MLIRFVQLAALASASHAAIAHVQAPPPPPTSDLVKVTPGAGDDNPLAQLHSDLSKDLRMPIGFGSVYYIPASADGSTPAQFVRYAGAIAAVFPRSEYIETKNGTVSVVPSGTVFHLVSSQAARPATPTPATQHPHMTTQASQTVSPAALTAQQINAIENPAVARRERANQKQIEPARDLFSDEPYRRRRIAALLRSIAETS